MYYECKHFALQELVDRNTHISLGNSCWMLFRPEALITLDKVRDYFGKPIIINNWAQGGSFSLCGFRPYNSAVGAQYSQHRLGNAFDLHFNSLSADEVRAEIIKNKDHVAFQYITCLEIDITWVHLDFRNIPDRIRLIKP